MTDTPTPDLAAQVIVALQREDVPIDLYDPRTEDVIRGVLRATLEKVDILERRGIIEIAVANKSGSISDYMRHWEGRALRAEAEIAALRLSLERLEDVG